MKKLLVQLSALLFAAVILILLFGVWFATVLVQASENINKAELSTHIPYDKLGEFLSGSASAENAQTSAEKIYDNSGMDGGDGVTHKHSHDEKKMWLSEEGFKGAEIAVTIELERVNQIGLMLVWNYFEKEKSENGLRNVSIDYSVDNIKWFKLGDYEFAQANNNLDWLPSTDLVDGSVVDFGGVSAKYIRITPHEIEGNWGGNCYGLSEVKFYEFKEPTEYGSYIKASPYHLTSMARVESMQIITNGLGMSDPKSLTALHDNEPDHMWSGSTQVDMIPLNLKGTYPLSKIAIWNYNDPDHLNYGVLTIEIKYNVDVSATDSDEHPWKTLGEYSIPSATGSNNEPVSLVIDCNNVKAQGIQINIKSNHGGDKNGISKIRVYCGEGDYIEPAHQWTSLLDTYKGGASGFDGFFSVNLSSHEYFPLNKKDSNSQTFFVFSDTNINGSINEVTRTASGRSMVNNSFAVFTGTDPYNGSIKYIYNSSTSGGGNVPMKPTGNRPGSGARYWQGAPLVLNSDKVYVTPHYVCSSSGGMGFAHAGAELAWFGLENGVVNFKEFGIQEDLENKYLAIFDKEPVKHEIIFNAGFLVNTANAGAPNPDGYVYNYGIRDYDKAYRNLVVMRVRAEDFEDFEKYEYFTGSGWSKNIRDCAPLADNVSPELSVTPITFGENKGKYMVIYQRGTNSYVTAMRVADTPWGPFGEEQLLHYSFAYQKTIDCIRDNNPDIATRLNVYGYNAKAHPALSNEGELIISYNMNAQTTSGGGNPQNDCVDAYRPRFLRMATTDYSPSDPGIIEDINQNNSSGSIYTESLTIIAAAFVIIVLASVAVIFFYNIKRNLSK